MRGSISVASIVEKIRENRRIWLRHIMKQEKTKIVRNFMKMNNKKKRKRGRPKKKKKRWIRFRRL